MAETTNEDLMARLAERIKQEQGNLTPDSAAGDPVQAVATAPADTSDPTPASAAGNEDGQLDDVLRRVRQMTTGAPAGTETNAAENIAEREEFIPQAPETLLQARLTDTQVEALILKFLLSRGEATGRAISDQVCLPFRLVESLLFQMKRDQFIAHKNSAQMNDYVYNLGDFGRERARRYQEDSTYFGAAPVSLPDYIASVKAQTIEGIYPDVDDLNRAFSDLLVDPDMLRRLGPAINSGRGLFLYGAPGNGKTSVAERVTEAFGKHVWIPKALGIDGEIIRVFDPINHVLAPLQTDDSLVNNVQLDGRWVRIARPTIVVGGELTMENLEVTYNAVTGISEAPMQLKSNCGTLVIDDFGRQRMAVDELLNRWIVPLEKRYDYLNLASGKKIQVPFDQLVIFSTNLEPRDLVDEAFLRRIPYKIEAVDPSEEYFRKLFEIMAPKVKVEYKQDVLDYLVEKHYKEAGRNFRNCHPRDLLLQVRNLCLFEKREAIMSHESIDFAVENYFSVM